MSRLTTLLASGWLALSALGAAAAPEELARQLDGLLRRTAAPGATWGVKVVSLASGRTLFATNDTRLLVPASNSKLFTAALALDRLGADHRLMTSLRVPAASEAPTIRGDLLVVGAGDPTFTERLNGGDWQKAFAPLVEVVLKAGIRRIEGNLVADTSRFRTTPYGPGWGWEDLTYYYGAAVSALGANDNILRVVVTPGARPGVPVTARLEPLGAYLPLVLDARTGPTNATARLDLLRLPGQDRVFVDGVVPAGGAAVTEEITVPSPALYFGELLKLALSRRGVTVTGNVHEVDWRERRREPLKPDAWRELGTVASSPLGDVVREMMKPSQNLYAHLLLLLAGSETERQPRPDERDWQPLDSTDAAGVRALRAFLLRAGISTNEVTFEEGSGLSRKNLITPNAAVQLLARMRRHPAREAWWAALPVGGVDGTLRNRFRAEGVRGRVHAKTGTLRHVSALSGYLDTAAGEPLAFSIIVNGFVPTPASVSSREEIDRLVGALLAFTGKSDGQ